MCVNHMAQKAGLNNPLAVYVLVILLGILVGVSTIVWLQQIGFLLADIFMKIFRCISLPIIALSVVTTFANLANDITTKKLWQRTIVYTFATTMIAASVSCLLYIMVAPENLSEKYLTAGFAANNGINDIDYFKHLSSIVPSNIMLPFLEHQVLSVLLLSIVFGVAIKCIPANGARTSVINFFNGLHAAFLVIVKWIIAILPLGLFGLIVTTVFELKNGIDLKGLGEYFFIIIMANLVQGFIVLPIWLRFNGIKPFEMMRKMMPALSVAFFSKSSAGTLPITMATVEKNLGVTEKTSRFVLPLCTSLNMNGCAAFIFVTIIYFMQNYGFDVGFGTMFLWVIVSTIAAVGNAGVPMGCYLLSASLLSGMNIPITLMGIILPFYNIIDMIETALNVWSDSCVVKVVDVKVNI